MNALRPVRFTVMPFGKKKTDAPAGSGPAEVDFDARDAKWSRNLALRDAENPRFWTEDPHV